MRPSRRTKLRGGRCNVFAVTPRSFVRREGRITRAQARALEELWPHYGIEPGDGPLALADLFGRRSPTVLEIGFGNGTALTTMAAAAPELNFLGIEVYRPGVGALLRRLQERGLENVRVLMEDAVEVLRDRLVDASLDRILIFFPDPWPKKRHHKRRLLQAEFVALAAARLQPGGCLHLTTDWQDYAQQMLAVLTAEPRLCNLAADGGYCDRPDYRPATKYEHRGEALGHPVWDLIFRRVDDPARG